MAVNAAIVETKGRSPDFASPAAIPNIFCSISIIIGGFEMVLGYFLYETIALGYPAALALLEVPFNIVQMLAGLIIAVPIVHAIQRIFPQLKSYL